MAYSFGRGALAFVLVVFAQTGCFSDQPTQDGEGTTDGGCAVGSLGCVCTDGNGCDVGLTCLLPARMCIDDNCTPGEGLCSCDAAAGCAEGYVCMDEYCAPIDGDTIGAATDPGTDASPTLPSETFATSDVTDGTTSPTTDSSPPTSGTDVTGFPTTSTSGQPMTCSECIQFVSAGDCSMYWPCDFCGGLFDCFTSGMDSCCERHDPFPLDWNEFATCVDIECEGLCPTTLYCGVGAAPAPGVGS